MKLEYLLFDLMIFTFSTGAILFTKKNLPHISTAFKSILVVSVPFLIWDHLVTNIWWSFNPKFTLPIRIFSLPLEEILFFFIVPWSCLLIWVNIKTSKQKMNYSYLGYFFIIFTIFLIIESFLKNWIYLFCVTFIFLFIQIISLSKRFFSQIGSLIFISIVLFLTTIFNGYLTSRPIVEYSPKYLSQIFIYTIPIEDYFYGLILICGTILLYEKFLQNSK